MHSRLMCLALTLAVSLPCYTQHIHGEPLRRAISGATNPQLIPETVAYRLFLSALWAPSSTTSDAVDRLRAIVRKASLSESELALLPSIVEAFHANMTKLNDHISAVRKGAGAITSDEELDFETQCDAATNFTTAELEHSLSSASVARLHALIMAEKANMTAFLSPDMSRAKVNK